MAIKTFFQYIAKDKKVVSKYQIKKYRLEFEFFTGLMRYKYTAGLLYFNKTNFKHHFHKVEKMPQKKHFQTYLDTGNCVKSCFYFIKP